MMPMDTVKSEAPRPRSPRTFARVLARGGKSMKWGIKGLRRVYEAFEGLIRPYRESHGLVSPSKMSESHEGLTRLQGLT